MILRATTRVRRRSQPSTAGKEMGFVAVGELIEVAPNLIEEANGYQWRQIVGSGYWVAERVKDGERYFDVVAEPDPLPDPEPPPEDEVILFNEIFS